MGHVRAFAKHVRWTADEVAIIQQHYRTAPRAVLLRMLPERTESQIQNKANLLGIVRTKKAARTPAEVREAKRLHMARRRESAPEAVREYQRQRHHKNRERNLSKMRGYYARRFFWARAMKLRGVGRATAQDIARLWHKQRGRCALTGKRLDRTAQLDHILPRARGGGHQLINLQWVCPEVNYAKRDLTQGQFVEMCREVMHWIGERIDAVERLTEVARCS